MHTLPEWTDLRFFLELARAGTLSGASRRLEVEHTTVARRIDRLEAQLGTTLFDRSREGYELTEMGQALLPHAEAMESAALAATEQLSGNEVAVHGVVRLGVPELFAPAAEHLQRLRGHRFERRVPDGRVDAPRLVSGRPRRCW